MELGTEYVAFRYQFDDGDAMTILFNDLLKLEYSDADNIFMMTFLGIFFAIS